MSKPLDTINIHTFLQLMEAPLVVRVSLSSAIGWKNRLSHHSFTVLYFLLSLHMKLEQEKLFINSKLVFWQTEANVDPSEADVVHNHLNVPMLYLFSHPQTKHLDRATAQTLALKLRGDVGVVLIHRYWWTGVFNAFKHRISFLVSYFFIVFSLLVFRESSNVKTPLKYNAAYRLPREVRSTSEYVRKY